MRLVHLLHVNSKSTRKRWIVYASNHAVEARLWFDPNADAGISTNYLHMPPEIRLITPPELTSVDRIQHYCQ